MRREAPPSFVEWKELRRFSIYPGAEDNYNNVLQSKAPVSAPCKQRFSGASLSEYKSYVVNISCHQISSHQTVLATQCFSPHTQSHKSEINLTDRGGA